MSLFNDEIEGLLRGDQEKLDAMSSAITTCLIKRERDPDKLHYHAKELLKVLVNYI